MNMTCDRCDESREAGYEFCIGCGEPIDDCPECDASRSEGFAFCPRCGRALTQPESEKPGPWRPFIALAAAIVTALLVIEVVALIVGAPSVWSWAADSVQDILILKPELHVAGYIGGLSLQLFWAVQVAVLLASAFILFRQSTGALTQRDIVEAVSKTPMYHVAMLLCAALLLNVLVILPEIGSLEVADTPSGFVPEALYAYANAAVWEEVIARIAFIGVPMAVLAACHLRRDFSLYLLGGFGMSRLALVLIFVSAMVFGFAHMPGWGLWKVLPTFISGFAMGYLYVRFGIHASIMFHFAVDYMGVLVVGPAAIVVSLIMFAVIVLGIPSIIEIARKIWANRSELREMPAVMPPDQESIFFRRD